MTSKELNKIIKESPISSSFKDLEYTFSNQQIGYTLELKGFSAIYKFVAQQVDGWSSLDEDIPQEFINSKNYFDSWQRLLERFINMYKDGHDQDFKGNWQYVVIRGLGRGEQFPFDAPHTEFLLEVSKKQPDSFIGAYYFVTGEPYTNSKENFIGSMLAYEFELQDGSYLPNRRNQEKASINRLRSEFKQQMLDSDEKLRSYFENADERLTTHSSDFDNAKTAKEEEFQTWLEQSQEDFTHFDSESQKKVNDLETTYGEQLRLKKPAKYWNTRATVLKKEGWKALYWLVGLVVFACVTLYFLLWLTPEGMLLSFIKGDASALKWSIVYITFISFMAYGIRALNKVAFSSFHLARDAEEREQLTHVYLSLVKDSAVDERDKTLIMQSLFSRADTGLLKDDSGPTMPNDLASKFLSSK